MSLLPQHAGHTERLRLKIDRQRAKMSGYSGWRPAQLIERIRELEGFHYVMRGKLGEEKRKRLAAEEQVENLREFIKRSGK